MVGTERILEDVRKAVNCGALRGGDGINRGAGREATAAAGHLAKQSGVIVTNDLGCRRFH